MARNSAVMTRVDRDPVDPVTGCVMLPAEMGNSPGHRLAQPLLIVLTRRPVNSALSRPMTALISGMAPLSLARTMAVVSTRNAGPETGAVSVRGTSASSRTLIHRPDVSSAPRYDWLIRYQ